MNVWSIVWSIGCTWTTSI